MKDELLPRRRFLAGSTACGLAALGGCGVGPVRTTLNAAFEALPASTENGKAYLGWHDSFDARRTCEQAVAQVTDLKWLSRGDVVFLKLASNSPYPHPAVTWPEAVLAVVQLLQDRGARVIVGDQAGVGHVRRTRRRRRSSTRQAMARNGLLDAIKRSGARLWCFDDHGWSGYFRAASDFDDHWKGRLWLPKVLRKVQHVVNLPRLGSHVLAGITGATKIAVGWLRDDSRRHLHQNADSFFEQIAEISHFPALRGKLRLSLTVGEGALLNVGPDIGSRYDFHGLVALASRRLVDHDLIATSVIPWLDRDDTSIFDAYRPYPGNADFWNRSFVTQTWGEEAGRKYRPLVPFELGAGLARDRCLSHLATLQRYRPERVDVVTAGDGLPVDLLRHLRQAAGGMLRVAQGRA